jgi:predicted DNA-binding WGR domain protein
MVKSSAVSPHTRQTRRHLFGLALVFATSYALSANWDRIDVACQSIIHNFSSQASAR